MRTEGTVAPGRAVMTVLNDGEQRIYQLTSTAPPHGLVPAERQITITESPGRATIRTGNALFDGLYALASAEARANSVSQISDPGYAHGAPISIEAFQTGELWNYVWTRDLAYALHLGLAGFDPPRAVSSLLFKASELKGSARGGTDGQIVQDTGSGGSYPVSTDRVVWALGAHETLKNLCGAQRQDFLAKVYPILRATIEQDRRLAFDPSDGLYRGEQSFLDWREQTYPHWTKDSVLPIAVSKALSVNVANYFLLGCAAEYAGRLEDQEARARYAAWAEGLRAAINRRFWDEGAGLYSTYLLSDDGVSDSVRVRRYDLLGESLAILCGVADETRAAAILRNYPTGPSGPPVVWPQDRAVPIYHNQGIWPFVTAYWLKAARQVGNEAAIDAGVRSLEELTALNLSNMEDYDFATGAAEVRSGPRVGPVVNSRRQLWSVGGYLSMVQEVVFGLETSWDGIRFRPSITARMRREIFGGTDAITWQGLEFQGTRHLVRMHLPPAGSYAQGICTVSNVQLNGANAGRGFVPTETLRAANEWDIYLKEPETGFQKPPPSVDTSDERNYCGPAQPCWQEVGQGGITLENDLLTLHFEQSDSATATLNIYRDGQLVVGDFRGTTWTDPESGDHPKQVHTYRLEAVDARRGLTSHLTPARSYRLPDQAQVFPASSLRHRGGDLVGGHHFENWGAPEHELSTEVLTVNRRGVYLVRVEFSNGAGPVNTGITCAVKKLEVLHPGSSIPIAAGYVVMPQSGSWQRFDLSSAVPVELVPDEKCVLRLSEDEHCLNMSYLRSNEPYTAAAGGGAASYNFANIAALHLLYLTDQPGVTAPP